MIDKSLLYEAVFAYVSEKYAGNGYIVLSHSTSIVIINESVRNGPTVAIDFNSKSVYGSMLVKDKVTEMYTIMSVPFDECSILECIDNVIEAVFITRTVSDW